MHHVHGIINTFNCALWAGAECEMFDQKFNAGLVWERLLREEDPVSVFMAVPTVYNSLTRHLNDGKVDKTREEIRRIFSSQYRLMVSGSAALPETQMASWFDISGQILLERFGMTEIGMGLSNPYHPVTSRQAGHVGSPLPGVEATMCDLDTGAIFNDTDRQGELLIKSKGMFDRYLNKPEATAECFTEDGWFRTGDCVAKNAETGAYKILGRLS